MAAIRSLCVQDLPRLGELDPNFSAESIIEVCKAGAGLNISWSLRERRLAQPDTQGRRYDLLPADLEELQARLLAGDGLYLVAEDAGRIIALLDLELSDWNNAAWLWNILIDRAYRRQGLGRRLFARAVAWARQRGLRALLIETQSNNAPACHFYAAQGCDLVGLNDFYYTNEDLELGEVALFWAYRVNDDAPGAE
jgi:GNAT superfamily N-acetyltransferase